MIYLDTVEGDLSQIPSLYTIGVIALLGIINLYLFKRFRSVELIQRNADNWESLYRSEEEKNRQLLAHNTELEKTVLVLSGKIEAMEARIDTLKHMPDFQKIYDLLLDHHTGAMKEWTTVREFLDNHVEVIQIRERRDNE